jgi:Raf kinase inhibitor-like YbhB/YbcL family protein
MWLACARWAALAMAVGIFACSSDDSGAGTPTAGASGAGGSRSTGGSGGVQATGGSSGSLGSGGTSGSQGSGGESVDAQADTGGSAGSNADASADVGRPDAASGFTLTSSAFTEGGMIPTVSTCAGANTSPPLSWTPGPAATQSYAIIFTDRNNSLIHWILWDIPAATMSLPADLPKTSTLPSLGGAKQVAFTGTGYAGPCPGGSVHTYEFALYAVDVAPLPGVTTSSTRPTLSAAILSHQLAKAILTGTSNAQR